MNYSHVSLVVNLRNVCGAVTFTVESYIIVSFLLMILFDIVIIV